MKNSYPLLFATAAALALPVTRAPAQSTFTATAPNPADYQNAANWTNGVPNGVGASALFSSDIPAGTLLVNLNGAVTLGNLTLGDSNTATNGFYSLQAGTGGTLTFSNTSGNATLQKTTGNGATDSITAPVILTSSLSADVRTGTINVTGVVSGGGSVVRTAITNPTVSGGNLILTNNANSYTGSTTVESGILQGTLNRDILAGANSVFGNSSSAIVIGTAATNAFTSAGTALNLVAGSDAANYTVNRGIDFSQSTATTSATLNFNPDGVGTSGVNTNTLTLAGALTTGTRLTQISAQRSGMTVNITGDIVPSGVTTGSVRLNGFPSDPNQDGRAAGTIRFSNLARNYAGANLLITGRAVVDGVVGALNTASPIGQTTFDIGQGSGGNIVGAANFGGPTALAIRDTSPDSNRGVFLESAGSSFARILAPGPGSGSIPAGGGSTTNINVINSFQFGGLNTTGATTFSGAITPGDVAVGNSTTNPITLATNIALIAANGGTTVFSGVISDSPSTATNSRVTINQVRNHPNLDGNNGTNAVSDGVADAAANQLVGTATTGTVILSGANTYEAGTEVLGGRLLVNNAPGTGSGTGLGAVTVAPGATLGGTGTVGGVTGTTGTVINNGILSPGDPQVSGGIGTLTLGSSTAGRTVTFGAGSSLSIQVGVGVSDKITVFGDLDLSTTTDTLAITGTLDGTTSYVIATFTGARTGTFDTVTGLTGNYVVQYNTNNITLAVPEPSTWVMLAGGVLALTVFTVRRRQIV